jgi:anti-sigma factor RsiW
MSCAAFEDRLDDYVDGALDEASFQDVEAHLAGCAACRERERELRALLAAAAALPRTVAPPRDLWPGVAARLGRPRVVAWPRLPSGRPALLAAAAVLLAAVAGLALLRGSRPAAPPGPGTAALAVPAAAGLPLELVEADAAYTRAASDLRGALEARRAVLAPDTLRVLDRNLDAIDAALGEIRAALAKDPTSVELGRMLRTAHKRKLDVLQRVARLT